MFSDIALKLAQERQKKIYKKLYSEHRDSHRALHWSTTENQKRRFDVLMEIGELEGKKILDIGCGMGDFFGHLHEHGVRAEMTGYDIVEEFLNIARRRHPRCTFKPINLSRSSTHEKFDYVFSSGVFAFGNMTFFETMVKKAYTSSRIAYGFNIYRSEQDERFMNISRRQIERFLKRLNPSKVVCEEGYLENDMTFFVYR